ncbi:MAG: DUF1622 domain-containing protein [Gammaproteobacteria bacterium]|nr:DUF1622 domain-containing protein [Gammaproteobacteria bacterium]
MVLFSIKAVISAMGTFIILVGVIISLYRFLVLRFYPRKIQPESPVGVNFIRRDLGQTIVLGLEFIIAADVIETTTTPDYYSLGILATIVVIRTFLSFSLSREISQLSPSQKNKLTE